MCNIYSDGKRERCLRLIIEASKHVILLYKPTTYRSSLIAQRKLNSKHGVP